MLKLFLLSLFACIICPLNFAYAQGEPIDELRAPAIPAFALQKGSVTTVPVPTTPSEFSADLQTLSSGNGPRQGYGVEGTLRSIFAPNQFETFRESLYDGGIASDISRTAAISIATGPSGIPSDSSGTGISLGLRVQPAIGHASDTVFQTLRRYDIERLWPGSIIDELKTPRSSYLPPGHKYDTSDIKRAVDSVIADFKPISKNKPNPPNPSEWNEIRMITNQIVSACSIVDSSDDSNWVKALGDAKEEFLNSDTAKKLLHSLHDLSLNRYGFVCELDLAEKWDWIGSTSNNEHFEKMGAWASFGFKDESSFNIAVLARYLLYTPLIDSSNRLELGASLGYHGAQWNITGEYLGHQINELSSAKLDSAVYTNRYDLNITYSPNSLLTASLTIGKDFTDSKAKITPVLAALGFNFNWSYLSKLIAKTQ